MAGNLWRDPEEGTEAPKATITDPGHAKAPPLASDGNATEHGGGSTIFGAGPEATAQAPALSESEAIYAFAGWLTTRPGSLVAGSAHGAAEWADAVEQFRLTQGWAEPRQGWADRIKSYSHATPEARKP